MPQPYYYAFLDESGDVSPFSGSRFLVIAVLVTAEPRSIELHIKRAHKKYGTSLASGEMKADASQDRVIEHILRLIAGERVAILAIIVDKRAILRPPKDSEDIYRQAVGYAVHCAVKRWPRLELCLDKRYTNATLRHRLEKAVRERIAELYQEVVLIRQEDSVVHKELQAVDFVAWAFFQKYERGNAHFTQLLAKRVVVEQVMRQMLW